MDSSSWITSNGQLHTTQVNTETLYLPDGMVYENKYYSNAALSSLQYTAKFLFAAHEEGRIRALYNNAGNPNEITGNAYDYFLKDHLGNVRMVLTDEVKSDAYPTLSFEGNSGTAEVQNQDAVWENASGQSINVASRRTASSGVLTNSGLTPPPLSNSILVRSSTGKIGAAKLLKVMAGDKVHTSVQYYYPTTSGSGTGSGLNTLVSSLATMLANSMGTGSIIKSGTAATATAVQNDAAIASFFNTQNSTPQAGKPKAYLNVLFFDSLSRLSREEV